MHQETIEHQPTDVLRVLAEPTRLQVVRILLRGPRKVGEINKVLGLEQSLLSHHLRVLREAGLVEGGRNGQAVYYRLSPIWEFDPPGTTLDLLTCRFTVSPAGTNSEDSAD